MAYCRFGYDFEHPTKGQQIYEACCPCMDVQEGVGRCEHFEEIVENIRSIWQEEMKED